MLFNSAEYLFFFLAVLACGWLLVGWPRLRIWVLLLASYYFYVANNHWLIVLILVSTQIDYVVAKRIDDTDDPRRRKAYLMCSLVGNLGILAFFKYFNFFVDSAVSVGAHLGLETQWVPWNIALPVGISFYTFQSMSYTIDVYYGRLPAERSWSRFAFYVTYFPQLVAGPIMRATEFMPQIGERPRLDVAGLESSLALIARGLLKKIVLADFVGEFADQAFDHPGQVSTLAAWVGLYAFTFQIYFDFSGYSDIAIGCSRLMGYHLPDNFDLPYAALSFSDFWRRWHISLSTWLRDYLYVPLGGNRMPTAVGVYRNLMLTMLLGGLWHGAAWHFVIWGALHGGYLLVERHLDAARTPEQLAALGRGRRFARRVIVFQAVVLTWLVFRAQTMELLGGLIQALFGSRVPADPSWGTLACAVVCAGALAVQHLGAGRDLTAAFLKLPVWMRGLAYSGLALAVIVFNSEGARPFIYFQF